MNSTDLFQTTTTIFITILAFFDIVGLIYSILSTKIVQKQLFKKKKSYKNINFWKKKSYKKIKFWKKKILDNWWINFSIYFISFVFHTYAMIGFFSK